MIIDAIDISSIFRAAWEASQGKDYGEAQRRVLELVARLRDAGAERIVCACDNGISFRRAIEPTYKAKRPVADEVYLAQLGATLDRLTADGATVWLPPRHELTLERDGKPVPTYYEADDLLAGLAAWWRGCVHKVESNRLRIVTRDRDLWALVDDGLGIEVILPNGAKGDQHVREKEVREHFGVDPSRVWEVKAIAGDDVDGYDPYPGVGLGTAAKLIRALPEGEGPADAIVAVLAGEDVPFGVALKTNQRATIREGGLAALKRATACARMLEVTDGAAILRPIRGRGKAERARFDVILDDPVLHDLADEPAKMPPREPEQQASAGPRQSETLVIQARQPTSLARLDPYALEPANPQELESAARIMAKARLYPNIGGEWEAYFAVMAWGRALHQPMSVALANAHTVKGRVGWSANFLASVVRAHPSCLKLHADLKRCDDKRATIVYQRDGVHDAPEEYVVTLDDARRAQWASEQWTKRPKVMLIWAALREVCRIVWGDVVLGVYGADEIRQGGFHDAEELPAELVQ